VELSAFDSIGFVHGVSDETDEGEDDWIDTTGDKVSVTGDRQHNGDKLIKSMCVRMDDQR
jgi:hypothetical protein